MEQNLHAQQGFHMLAKPTDSDMQPRLRLLFLYGKGIFIFRTA